ncbi:MULTISPECIES: hypothetical protein [unclassified Breznakia]|uniref:hypothetical protein n=1 Tax=unclassified Breznakia TaxID=2623764 RepID=UPI002404CA04|nr:MULTISPECIES: hypothetical protein [unclassified Breznakia]MDF9838789.1 hypothetical protein [Breznakia sp. PFB2-8]MDF9860823.1 hypothetical protein [Breznakia sp. PH5-24]
MKSARYYLELKTPEDASVLLTVLKQEVVKSSKREKVFDSFLGTDFETLTFVDECYHPFTYDRIDTLTCNLLRYKNGINATLIAAGNGHINALFEDYHKLLSNMGFEYYSNSTSME